MGFARPNLKLRWAEPHELAGLEIRIRRLSIGQALRLTSLADLKDAFASGGDATAELDELFHILAGKIIGWNLEDGNGAPVPVSVDTVCDLDIDMVLWIVEAWLDSIGGTNAPLAPTPAASEEAALDIPMEVMASL